jgi:hypothetical protein
LFDITSPEGLILDDGYPKQDHPQDASIFALALECEIDEHRSDETQKSDTKGQESIYLVS